MYRTDKTHRADVDGGATDGPRVPPGEGVAAVRGRGAAEGCGVLRDWLGGDPVPQHASFYRGFTSRGRPVFQVAPEAAPTSPSSSDTAWLSTRGRAACSTSMYTTPAAISARVSQGR